MQRRDNYRIQADQAKARFLTYDQDALIRHHQRERRETLALIKHRRTPEMEFAGSKGIDRVQ